MEVAFSGQVGGAVFHTNQNGNSDIYAISAGGYRRGSLARGPAEDSRPCYSPGARKIVSEREVLPDESGYDIYGTLVERSGGG